MCQVDSPLHLGFLTAAAGQPVRQQPPHCARLRDSTGLRCGQLSLIISVEEGPAMPVRAGCRLGVAKKSGVSHRPPVVMCLPASQNTTPPASKKHHTSTGSMRDKAAATPWSSSTHKEMKRDLATARPCRHPPHLLISVVSQPQAPAADVAHCWAADHAHNLCCAAPIITDRQHVRHVRGQAAQSACEGGWVGMCGWVCYKKGRADKQTCAGHCQYSWRQQAGCCRCSSSTTCVHVP